MGHIFIGYVAPAPVVAAPVAYAAPATYSYGRRTSPLYPTYNTVLRPTGYLRPSASTYTYSNRYPQSSYSYGYGYPATAGTYAPGYVYHG